MAIAAGKSAEESRWVKFSELAPQLCELDGELGGGLSPEQVHQHAPQPIDFER